LRRTAVGPYESLIDVDWRARTGHPILPRLSGRTGIRQRIRYLSRNPAGG
jgi:hypothetical protein